MEIFEFYNGKVSGKRINGSTVKISKQSSLPDSDSIIITDNLGYRYKRTCFDQESYLYKMI